VTRKDGPGGGASPAPPVRVLAEGRFLRFVDEGGWEYVVRPNASGVVVIVAITPEGRLILVEQHRPAVHARVVELPAGLAGDSAAPDGEAMETAAHRELIEETGYAADEMVRLAEGPVAVGVASEVVTFFHARGLRRVGPGGGDATESITVHEIPLADLRAWLAQKQQQGALVDPKLFAGLYLIGAAA
jgi:ADP-ribose pyrophosphatase